MARTSDQRALLALLGVDENASWDEVRSAFRVAVRASHPDLHGGDPAAERRVKTLNAAWEVVNTPRKWSEYAARIAGSAGRHGPPGPSVTAVASVGHLQVLRQRAGSAGLRRWNVELDGDIVATVENGGASLMDAPPGRHSLRVFYEWYSSRPLEFAVRVGEELVFGCRQESNPLLSLYAPKRSLVLERIRSGQVAQR